MAISGIKSVFFTPIRGWKMAEEVSDAQYTDDVMRRSSIGLFSLIKSDPNFYQMDGVISENYKHSISLTRNPVENGVVISDHSFREPYVVTVDGIITNNPTLLQATNHIPGSYSITSDTAASIGDTLGNTLSGARIREAWTGLTELMNRRELITVYTALAVYSNMVLTNVSTVNDQKNQLRLNLTFTEAIVIDDTGITTQNALASAIYGIDLTRVLATAASSLSSAIGSL